MDKQKKNYEKKLILFLGNFKKKKLTGKNIISKEKFKIYLKWGRKNSIKKKYIKKKNAVFIQRIKRIAKLRQKYRKKGTRRNKYIKKKRKIQTQI